MLDVRSFVRYYVCMTKTNETTIRPEALAASLGVNGKLVRSYLRRTFPRPAEAKGSVWVLTEEVAENVRAHFISRRPVETTEA